MTVPDLKSDKLYAYADYADWDDDQRWELIEGVPYLMTGPGTRHQTILGELHLIVGNFLKNKDCRVFFAPCDVLLPEPGQDEKDVRNVFQPDLMVICDAAKIKEKYIWGAPDWVVEVLSPSTSKKDLNLKKHVYERFGVKEFWAVCPIYGTVTVFRLHEAKLRHIDVYDAADELEVSALPGLKIPLSEFLPSIKRVKEEEADYHFSADDKG